MQAKPWTLLTGTLSLSEEFVYVANKGGGGQEVVSFENSNAGSLYSQSLHSARKLVNIYIFLKNVK